MAFNGRAPAAAGLSRGGSGAGRWALLVASTAIFAATGYGWARFVVPSYRATSFVVVPPVLAEGAGVDAVLSGLRSGEALSAAAAALPPSVSTTLAGDADGDRSTDVERLARGLAVSAEAGAPVVAVSFRHRDPAVAEAVANAVGSSFVASRAEGPAPAASATPTDDAPAADALEAEILARRAALAQAEAALAAFDAEPVPVAADPSDGAAGRLDATRRSLDEARRALDGLEARSAALARVRGGPTVSAGSLPGEVAAALSRRDAARSAAASLADTYGDNHPRLRRGREDAAEAEAALDAALGRAEDASSAELARQRRAVAELDARERREAAALASVTPRDDGRAERRAGLLRAADEARTALDASLDRWQTARGAPALPAQVPESEPAPAGLIFTQAVRPSRPEERPILLSTAGFGLAGFLGGLLPFLFRRRRPDPKLWADTAAPTPGPPPSADPPAAETPALAPAPAPASEDRAPAAVVPGSPRVDELAEAVVASRMTRLLVFGASPGDGARAAVDLVRHLTSREGSAVLADLTESGEAAALMGRTSPAPGLADYVAGRCEIADLIHQDAASSAHLVCSGEGFDPRMLQGAPPKLVTLMQALEASYGCVVLHLDEPGPRMLGALMHEDAALIVAARLDDSLLVADLTDRLADAGSRDAIVLWLDPPPEG